MDLAEAIELLKQKCAQAGSQARWAEENGLSQTHVNSVIRGVRRPGKKILAAIGMKVDYQPIINARSGSHTQN